MGVYRLGRELDCPATAHRAAMGLARAAQQLTQTAVQRRSAGGERRRFFKKANGARKLTSLPGLDAEPATLSPLTTRGPDRFKRGLLVHRLLQRLPELPARERENAARRFLALPTHGLSVEEQEDVRRDTLAVLNHPEFAPLFAPGSQAEVPLVGLIAGHVVSAQIDRLVVGDDRVLIVDYKTLRPPPAAEQDVASIYLRQLAIYRAALARIYPGREIGCALLWTEGPRLMPISPEILAGYLP